MAKRALVAGIFLCLFATGCGKPQREFVTINGTVTYKGSPVVGGAIYLHSADNQVAMGPIHDDGTFTATEVPVGEVRISFQFKPTGGPAGGGMYGGTEKPKGVTSLPDTFNDPDKSGLKYTISRNTSTLDVKVE